MSVTATTLSPGSKLGPYEILSLLGAGGMGEVYRARDAKLNRDVALKILPALFTTDPDSSPAGAAMAGKFSISLQADR